MLSIRGVATFVFMGAIATAAPTIVFDSTSIGGHTGSISYEPRYALGGGPSGTGTGSTAVGKNIDIDSLTGIGTANNSGATSLCFFCTLNFQTGMMSNDSSPTGTIWSFNGGGYFQVTGGFDLDNNGVLDSTDVQPGTLLLSGVFNNPVKLTTPGSIDLKFTSAALVNIMDNRVDAFFGTPGNGVYNGTYGQTFEALRTRLNPNPTHANYNRWRFSTYGPSVTNPTGMMDGSIVNNLVVPEPLSLLLFGTTGGILVFCMRRRKV